MKKNNREITPIMETAKELGRILVFAIVSAILTVIIDFMAGHQIPHKDLIVMMLTLLLRVVDKYKHEGAKSDPKYDGSSKGIVGF